MVNSKAKTVDAFLQEQPAEGRAVLSMIRKAIRAEVPEAAESMEHGMPYYRLGEKYWAFTAQKNYFAVYFSTPSTVARLAKETPGLDCGKSCVRFRSFEQLSVARLRKALHHSAR